MRTILAFWILILIGGCSGGISERIKEHKIEYFNYPENVKEIISKGQVVEGYTKTQVYIALGNPFKNLEVTPEICEIWGSGL